MVTTPVAGKNRCMHGWGGRAACHLGAASSAFCGREFAFVEARLGFFIPSGVTKMRAFVQNQPKNFCSRGLTAFERFLLIWSGKTILQTGLGRKCMVRCRGFVDVDVMAVSDRDQGGNWHKITQHATPASLWPAHQYSSMCCEWTFHLEAAPGVALDAVVVSSAVTIFESQCRCPLVIRSPCLALRYQQRCKPSQCRLRQLGPPSSHFRHGIQTEAAKGRVTGKRRCSRRRRAGRVGPRPRNRRAAAEG